MSSLIDNYTENIAKMKLSPDDYNDKKKVRNHNSISARNRKIAAVINTKNKELKDDFATDFTPAYVKSAGVPFSETHVK